ncbi:hypothetical protein FJT64_013623 [Amphibalanus amphitrite]|uniref:G8 domain-containing protein n=1 Tax=Amphibalanus amphitrite TaxID=1232801 RepID=A0A6A4VBW1_AMPAM|nr:hypothetical protein FJT64_013623 [Amphibalanus amphitrite]
MGTITIAAGGRLVFDATSPTTLTLSANMVELTGGEFWIGSEDCPYTGDAEVLLTGTRDESEGAIGVQKAVVGNALRGAGAIGKKLFNEYFTSPISSVRNVTFDFADPDEGSRFFDGDGTVRGFKERDGNRHNIVLDVDGSLTTVAGTSVVRPLPLLLNARCVLMPTWGPVLDEDLNGVCDLDITIIMRTFSDDGDCRQRAYPAYQTPPVTADGALTVPVFQ